MRLGDFSLEILVNNEVLPEYQIPNNNDNLLVPFSRVAVDKRESVTKECKLMTYVAVPEPSCHFAIRVGIHSTKDPHILKGIHIVDGKNDNTYTELNPVNSNDSYNYIYGFYNYNKSIFHLFKFDTTYWSDDNVFISNLPRCIPSKATKDKGVLGAISVYFYKAERLPEKRSSSKKYSNKNQNMDLSNSFDDLNFDPSDIIFIDNPQEESCLNLKTTHSYPIAVLHIHYQTKDWIKNYYKSNGLSIPKPLFNDSFMKKNEKNINKDLIIDDLDLWYGELTDVESESDYSSSLNSDSEQKEYSSSSNKSYIMHEKEEVVMTNTFNIKKKKKIIIDSDNSCSSSDVDKNLILSNNNKDKNNTNNFKEIVIADNNKLNSKKVDNMNYNMKVKVNKHLYNKSKNKKFSKVDQVGSKNFCNTTKNKKGVKSDNQDNNSNLNLEVQDKNSSTEVNVSNKGFYNNSKNNNSIVEDKVNSKNLNVEVQFKNMHLNDIVDKTLITNNISKEENFIIIDDDEEKMIIDDEILFISKTEFERKKIREIIDLTMD
ncbi:hypothetical protein C1645_880768 [Glomus cerebriforme]|uniref:Uncharacterized protein n=1 Tax=Glomus cerebriforme TaxID=658196 RepID=A0A397SJK0_9GLOM|nr:hypothetical protein C1645_880768 [Glomus cerebriforme]